MFLAFLTFENNSFDKNFQMLERLEVFPIITLEVFPIITLEVFPIISIKSILIIGLRVIVHLAAILISSPIFTRY